MDDYLKKFGQSGLLLFSVMSLFSWDRTWFRSNLFPSL